MGGDNSLGGGTPSEEGILYNIVKASGNMLVGRGGNLGVGGRAIIGGFVLSPKSGLMLRLCLW